MSFELVVTDRGDSQVFVDTDRGVDRADGARVFVLEPGSHVLRVVDGALRPIVARSLTVNGPGSETVSVRSLLPVAAPVRDSPEVPDTAPAPMPAASDVYDVVEGGMRRGQLSPQARLQVASIAVDPRDTARLYREFDVITNVTREAAAWANGRSYVVVYTPELGFHVRALTPEQVQILHAVWEPAKVSHGMRNFVIGTVVIGGLAAIAATAVWWWMGRPGGEDEDDGGEDDGGEDDGGEDDGGEDDDDDDDD